MGTMKEKGVVTKLPSRQFYFLDYFYIMLKSIEKSRMIDEVFSYFKILKQEHRLGESKYKKLEEVTHPTERQQQRYLYTFKRVLEECKEYNLVKQIEDSSVVLSFEGRRLLSQYQSEGVRAFNFSIFNLFENAHAALRTLVEFLYKANSINSGVLVFPHYSPLQFNLKRGDIETTRSIIQYSEILIKKLEGDIKRYLRHPEVLSLQNQLLLQKLIADGLLQESLSARFNPRDYNKITKRIRDYWINYFLKELYKCPYSLTTFDIWCYRAKQVDVIQATESYPFINGRIVYPTSVVKPYIVSSDFKEIFLYSDDNRMYIHRPKSGAIVSSKYHELFIDSLVKGYYELKRQVRYNFINLVSLREIVCFQLKISMNMFEETLNAIYRLNLSGHLKIGISLEVDKLPEETSAMYIKNDPVIVDGSRRNVIAIDVTKRKV